MSVTSCVNTELTLQYITQGRISLEEILESLEGLYEILNFTPAFLEKCFPELKVTEIYTNFTTHVNGGIKESIVIKLFHNDLKNHKEAEAFLQNITQESGKLKLIIALGVGALIIFGLQTAYSTDNLSAGHIEAYKNLVINLGEAVDLSTDEIVKILNSFGDKKKIAHSALRIIKPVKGDPEAVIKINGNPLFTIPRESSPIQDAARLVSRFLQEIDRE